MDHRKLLLSILRHLAPGSEQERAPRKIGKLDIVNSFDFPSLIAFVVETVGVVLQRPEFININLGNNLVRTSDPLLTQTKKRTDKLAWKEMLWIGDPQEPL